MSTTLKVIVAVAAAIVLPVACSAYSIYASATTAPGRVISKTLETSNILTNYEMFHDESENFGARVSQINEQRGFLTAETDAAERSRLRMELAAQQQSCRELAADYNANSQKLNRNLFKDRGLPPVLDAGQCEN